MRGIIPIKDKRGDLFQLIPLMILIFIVATMGLFFFFLGWQFTGELQDSGELASQPNAEEVNTNIHNFLPYVNDELVFIFFLGMTIGLVIAAVRTNFNPVIVGLFFLLLIFAIFLAMGSAELYRGLADDPSVSEYSAKLIFTNILFSRYTPLIITVLGGLILLIQFGKSGGNIAI